MGTRGGHRVIGIECDRELQALLQQKVVCTVILLSTHNYRSRAWSAVDPQSNAALEIFHNAFAPFEYLNAVVVHELRAGVRPAGRSASALQRNVFDPFERIFTPSFSA
jgi:hypothetical protein